MPFVIYSKIMSAALNQVLGVVVVYGIRMLTVTVSKHGKLLFSFFYLVSSFKVNFGLV